MQVFYVYGCVCLACLVLALAAICAFVVVHFMLLIIDEVKGALKEWRNFK